MFGYGDTIMTTPSRYCLNSSMTGCFIYLAQNFCQGKWVLPTIRNFVRKYLPKTVVFSHFSCYVKNSCHLWHVIIVPNPSLQLNLSQHLSTYQASRIDTLKWALTHERDLQLYFDVQLSFVHIYIRQLQSTTVLFPVFYRKQFW